MEDPVVIYGLKDPVSDKIRYIGKTKGQARCRLTSHISEAKATPDYSRKTRWISNLLLDRLKPETVILEEVKTGKWQWRECFWIEMFRGDVFNVSVGGDTGGNWDIDARQFLSRWGKERYSDISERMRTSKAIRRAYANDPELRAHLSRVQKKRYANPAEKTKDR